MNTSRVSYHATFQTTIELYHVPRDDGNILTSNAMTEHPYTKRHRRTRSLQTPKKDAWQPWHLTATGIIWQPCQYPIRDGDRG